MLSSIWKTHLLLSTAHDTTDFFLLKWILTNWRSWKCFNPPSLWYKRKERTTGQSILILTMKTKCWGPTRIKCNSYIDPEKGGLFSSKYPGHGRESPSKKNNNFGISFSWHFEDKEKARTNQWCQAIVLIASSVTLLSRCDQFQCISHTTERICCPL